MRVADYIMQFVQNELNVDTIFMVSGGGIMHLTDAIVCNGKLQYVCSHNEQATTMEADGYAKTKGGFGVALVTTGPGATNAITGVVGAWQDSTKLLVISGQSKTQQTIYKTGLAGLRQFGVQEAHILPMISSVTKYAVMIDEPNDVKYHLEKAIYLASHGRPGPVWLDVPLDVQGASIEYENLRNFDPEKEGFVEVIDTNLLIESTREIATLLQKAKRPVIVAGHGVRIGGATEAFNRLIDLLNVPVVTPRLGIDLIDSNHPLYVGRPGIKGDRPANFAVQNADILLCIGTRLSINMTGHEYSKFARGAKVVVVDIDEVEHLKPTIFIYKFLKSDAFAFLNILSDVVTEYGLRKADDWPEKCRYWKMKYPVVLPAYSINPDLVNTYYFTDILSRYLDPKDVIIIDSGSSSYVVSQSIVIKAGQRFLGSGGLGAMGYAVPAALGASIARGRKRVIAITGDGSLHMNIQELQTIAHEKLPVKIFVFNNHGYASIKTTQHNYFNSRYVGVDNNSGVPLPDLLKVAELYGIKGIRIENTKCISTAIEEALEHDGPVICDIYCSQDQLIIPTVFSKKLNDGRMVSLPLEDMFPFLDREDFKREMIIEPLPESL